MVLQENTSVSDEDLQKAIVELLQKSGKPLNVKAISRNLPKMYKVPEPQLSKSVTELSSRAEIHSWGKTRGSESFSAETPGSRVRAALLDALTEPLSGADWQKRAAKNLPGLATGMRDKLLKQSVKELLASGEALKLPRTSERIGPVKPKTTFEEAFGRLLQEYEDVTRARIELVIDSMARPASPGERQSLAERIEEAMLTVEPEAKDGALASLPKVRQKLDPPVAKEEFDMAVMQMVSDGTLSVHEFIGYLQVSEDERAELVFDGQEYYGGVTFRH